jgi:lipopolysaccharide biosynthesis glycosyltransferase
MTKVDKVRVFIGADRSQALAVKVLEHSIKRHTTRDVEVVPMVDLPIRQPKAPKNFPRTGFSYSRFCVPKLAGYKGKALYLDADMLALKDIAGLWDTPFDGAKVVIQSEIKHECETTGKEGAPRRRLKQCSVMLMDCGHLRWDLETIINQMDNNEYDYGMLMYELTILNENEIKYGIPFEWNSLEYYDQNTCLIHYTDMYTQPWTSCKNKNGFLWLDEVRMMLKTGALNIAELENEIALGYIRPSLIRDIKYGHYIPKFLGGLTAKYNASFDASKKYVPHREVYALKRIRLEAMRAEAESSE